VLERGYCATGPNIAFTISVEESLITSFYLASEFNPTMLQPSLLNNQRL